MRANFVYGEQKFLKCSVCIPVPLKDKTDLNVDIGSTAAFLISVHKWSNILRSIYCFKNDIG
jgi:hypothetical protein